MDVIALIAEEKIEEARKRGELDQLPGKGAPVELEDLSRVPDDLRAGYLLLKNSGVLPEELEIQKEMLSLQRLIDCCNQEEEKEDLRKKKNELQVRFNMLAERKNIKKEVLRNYQQKVYHKLRKSK